VTGADRFRLLGKYQTPRCRVGQKVRCQVHSARPSWTSHLPSVFRLSSWPRQGMLNRKSPPSQANCLCTNEPG
jgi:hypothetical protein